MMMGSTIRFSAAASYDNNPGAKTESSGVIIGDEVMGETPAKERINWLATDKIRIYSDVATDRNSGATWTKKTATVRPSWLTSNKYTGPGSITSENVKLTVAAAEMAHVDKDASTNKNAPYDLSTHDIIMPLI